MPRAVSQQVKLPPPPAEESALAVHRSAAQLRLEALEKEHERLLREITKKKAACELTEANARDASSALEAKIAPLRDGFVSTLDELRAIFKALLGGQSRLSKRDKARVRRLYAQLLPDLAAEDRQAEPGRDAGDDAGRRSPPFGAHGPRPGDHETDAGYSANKPSEKGASLLRALFRKLAVALHPDKVQDPKEREALTSVMKEVTRAYESGDVARLVEIDRTWLVPSSTHDREADLERRVADMLQANKELRRQLRTLTANLKDLKQMVPGMQSARQRGARSRATPSSEVDEMVAQMERELAHLQKLRDFARSFRDGDIDLLEFMLGPQLAFEDADDPFDQMLAEVMEAMLDAEPPARRGRGGRRR